MTGVERDELMDHVSLLVRNCVIHEKSLTARTKVLRAVAELSLNRFVDGLVEESSDLKLSADGSAMVDQNYYWRPMGTAPRSVKLQMLGEGGSAVYSGWDGRDSFWQAWAPLPKRRPV